METTDKFPRTMLIERGDVAQLLRPYPYESEGEPK